MFPKTETEGGKNEEKFSTFAGTQSLVPWQQLHSKNCCMLYSQAQLLSKNPAMFSYLNAKSRHSTISLIAAIMVERADFVPEVELNWEIQERKYFSLAA